MRLLAVTLAFAICPGAAEATEDLAHWLAEGHTVHSSVEVIAHDYDHHHDDDRDHHAGAGHDTDHEARHDARHENDEHGCSPLFHLCGCHSPTASVTSTLPVHEATVLHREIEAPIDGEHRRPGDGVVGEAFRPPIC